MVKEPVNDMERVLVVMMKDYKVTEAIAVDAIILPRWLKKTILQAIKAGTDVAIYHNVPDDAFWALPLTVSNLG